jgi:dienelactone hydrolase
MLLLGGCATAVRFESASFVNRVQLSGELFRPEGPGPFPAVVLLHACDGVAAKDRDWAGRLQRLGYVVLVVDSFSSRGISEICGDAAALSSFSAVRSGDAYGALLYLQRQPFVQPQRVALMGFSHGGFALFNTLQSHAVYDLPAGPFRAGVALYPWCGSHALVSFYAPILVLVGERDEVTTAASCENLARRGALGRVGPPVTLKTYPGAHHGFDNAAVGHYFVRRYNPADPTAAGFTVAYDAAAHADAVQEVARFLAEHLRGDSR